MLHSRLNSSHTLVQTNQAKCTPHFRRNPGLNSENHTIKGVTYPSGHLRGVSPWGCRKDKFIAVPKWPATGQGLQIIKWPEGSSTFPNKSRNLLGFIKWNSPIFIRNHQALPLTTIWFNFNVLSFLGIGSDGLFDGT